MTLRRTAAAFLVTALAVVGVAVAAVPAQAVSSYRYWSYWYANPGASAWTYGPIGPAGHGVADGGVEGWRFVVAAPNPKAPQPRHSAASAFDDICGSTARPTGKVRVALVVDFGTASDAPPHESPPASVVGTCVVVPEGSKGLTVLGGYSPRMESGLVCGLSGYPAHECGVVVKEASPTPTPKPSPTTSKPPKPSASAVVPPPAGSSSPVATGEGSSPTPSTSSSTSPAASSATPSPNGSSPSASTSSDDPVLAVGPPPPPTGGSGSGTPAGLLLGSALVVGVGAAAFLRTRRASS